MTVQYSENGKYNKPDFNHLNWHLEWQAMMDILDEAIHGTNKIEVTAGDVTPTIPDGATGTGRHKVIEFFGTAGVSRNATFPTVEGFWIIKNTSDGLVVMKMAAGLTVTIGRDRIALVYSDATDMIQLLQFDLKSTEFGETLGYLSDKGWRYEFERFDHHLWVQFQSDAANVVLDRDDDDDPGFPSQYGKGYVRFTAQTAYRFKFLLPFNPNVLYRIRFVLRQRTDGTASQNKIFLGVAAHKFDGTVVGIDGTSGETSANLHSVAAHNVDLEGLNSYQEYTGYFKGQSSLPTAQGTNDINNPGDLHEDARFFSPMFWVNGDNTNGLVDVAMVQVEELPGELDNESRLAVPVGVVLPYFGTTEPTGWFLCDGSEKIANSFPALFGLAVAGQAEIGLPTTKVGDFTTTFATNVLNLTAHGKVADDLVHMVSDGDPEDLPDGLNSDTRYYVINANPNDFQVSLTEGGAAVDFSDDGTGTHSLYDRFSIPDMRGRVAIGLDNLGGTPADVVTNAKADSLGGKEGSDDAVVVSHGHSASGTVKMNDGSSNGGLHVGRGSSSGGFDNFGVSVSVNSSGVSGGDKNMPPYMAMGYIIKH